MPRHEVAELREQRAAAFERQKQILDTAEGENRDLNGEETQEYDRLTDEFETLEKRIDRVEREERLAPQMGREVAVTDVEPGSEERKLPESYKGWLEQRDGGPAQDNPEYRQAFYNWMATGEAPPSSVLTPEIRAQSKATAGAGANLVPTLFERQLIDLLRTLGQMRSLATVITTDGGQTIQVPNVSAHGVATWTAENASFTETDETFAQQNLSAYKEARIVQVSEELLADSAFDLESFLATQIALSFTVLENTAYVVGTGSGQPTGFTTQASAGVTAATGNTVTIPPDNLYDLIHSVPVPYRRNGAFLMNDQSIKKIRQLKDSQNRYLFEPSLQVGQPNTLLGYGLYQDPDMPVMAANAKSIAFGDFSYYWIRDARGLALQRLVERYADVGQVGFRAYKRTDGRLIDLNAVKLFVNSAT
jgi:HK97 family phage major capsid protein